ncbi:transmembrane emp24 domain-containing protein p24beta2-like [Impatiens glandulifera]|uniref:transmembrane emp24 domain-containing protein p24beta2-like n=1 Tax=Impatiens glandulifera TaxID=253017 RepID=UPI001FB090D3|nr:transmembrane emp24 domain-containing protein p24beta2-like [Impatiens glandulifera]
MQIFIATLIMIILYNTKGSHSIRFVIDREECFTHNSHYEGATAHVSFVVIKSETSLQPGQEGVDLTIKGPSGGQIHKFSNKISEKHEFQVQNKGLYRFCFTNQSPSQETIDFDIYISHLAHFDQHATDDHLVPLMEQISKLEEALYNIQFEQHWLEAQTDRQAMVNKGMGTRAVHKAMFESAALIGASALQMFLLQRLFEIKLGRASV